MGADVMTPPGLIPDDDASASRAALAEYFGQPDGVYLGLAVAMFASINPRSVLEVTDRAAHLRE